MRSVFASCAAITSTLSAALTFRRNFFVAVPVATLLVASFQSPTFINRSLPFSTSAVAMSAVFDESSNSGNQDLKHKDVVDPDYPGTAVTRMLNIRERVRSLSTETLSGTNWSDGIIWYVLILRVFRCRRVGRGSSTNSLGWWFERHPKCTTGYDCNEINYGFSC